jgi:hypothetical protein
MPTRRPPPRNYIATYGAGNAPRPGTAPRPVGQRGPDSEDYAGPGSIASGQVDANGIPIPAQPALTGPAQMTTSVDYARGAQNTGPQLVGTDTYGTPAQVNPTAAAQGSYTGQLQGLQSTLSAAGLNSGPAIMPGQGAAGVSSMSLPMTGGSQPQMLSLQGTPSAATNTAAPPNLTGAPGQAGSGAYGSVPQVPNPINTQGEAISGNLGNMGGLYGLGIDVSRAGAAAAQQPYLQNLPGYANMMNQSSRNIQSDLAGQVSPDVINLLGQQAAERGVGFGAGAPNSNAALLRSLGLTSMGLQAQGQNELSQAIARTPTGPGFNPNSFLVSPSDLQSARTAANLYRSAPDPALAAAEAEAAARRGLNQGQRSGPTTPPIGGGGGDQHPTTTHGTAGSGSPWASDRGNPPTVYGPGGGPWAGGGFNFGGTNPSPWWAGDPQQGSIGDQLGQDLWNMSGDQGTYSGAGTSPEQDVNQWLQDQFPDLFGIQTTENMPGYGEGQPDFSSGDPYADFVGG